MKEQIILYTDSKVGDKKHWSGTTYSIYQHLSSFYNVEQLEMKPSHFFIIHSLIKLFYIIGNHTFFVKNKRKMYPLWFKKLQFKKQIRYINHSNAKYVFIIDKYIGSMKIKKPLVYYDDATYPLMIGYYYFNISKHDFKIMNYIQGKTINQSHKIIFSSNWAINNSHLFYKYDSKKERCIKFGSNIVDLGRIYKNINSETINILFCGVDIERKGLNIAIDTVNMLNRIDDSHTYLLEVVGIEGKSNNTIHYYGFKNKNNIGDFNFIISKYKEAHLLLFPTRAECSSIVFCEAAMFSLPIIATNTGGVPDYVIDGYNGELIELDEKIESIANKIISIIFDNDLYNTYSNNARTYYETELNWDCWAKTVYNFLDN